MTFDGQLRFIASAATTFASPARQFRGLAFLFALNCISPLQGEKNMLLLIILVVLIFGFGYGGYRMGPGIGYYGGGGLSLVLTIVVILLLLKVI
jgi:hypothetical protein